MSARFFPDQMPRPQADSETLPFWRAAAEHRLVLQECSACSRLRHPPGPVCPGCSSRASGWRELSGRGTVYSYTIVHRPVVPAQREQGPLPFAVVAVELEGAQGLRLVSNLVEADLTALRVGLPVELVWEDMGPELALPRFRPSNSARLQLAARPSGDPAESEKPSRFEPQSSIPSDSARLRLAARPSGLHSRPDRDEVA